MQGATRRRCIAGTAPQSTGTAPGGHTPRTMSLTPTAPVRLVLDTNVWLDLLVFADPRCAALRTALEGCRARALLREDCHAEWLRVLAYPALRLDRDRREALASSQRAMCEWVGAEPATPAIPLPRCRDPDDQKFLELAAQGGAELLLSRDQALLELGRRCKRQGLFAIVAPCALEVAGWRFGT